MKTLKHIGAILGAVTFIAVGQTNTPKRDSELTPILGAAVDANADFSRLTDASDGTAGSKRILLSEYINIPSFFGPVSKTELLYLDGVTSAIQAQLNAKQATITDGTLPLARLATDPLARANHTGTQALSTLAQSGASTGQVPTWNGTAWAAATVSGGSGVSSIALNNTGVLHTTPLNFTNTSGAWSGTQTLANQPANTLFGNFTGSSATPTFASLPGAMVNSAIATDAAATRNSLIMPATSDYLHWTAKDLLDNRGNQALVRMATISDSFGTASNYENLLRSQLGFYGRIGGGANGGGATASAQHTRYSVGSYSGTSSVLTASGHTVTFGGEAGGRGLPSNKAVIAYRRQSGGGVFQPMAQNRAGTFVALGSTINTSGAESVLWVDLDLAAVDSANSSFATQIRLDWVSGGPVEIIGGGMLAGSIIQSNFNRHGVLSYNMGANSSTPMMWNTIPQQAWDAFGAFYRPHIMLIRDFRDPPTDITTWRNALDSVVYKIQAGRKSGITASYSRSAPGGQTILTVTSDIAGITGESYRLKFLAAGINTPLTVSVTGNDITVHLATNGSGSPTSSGAAVVTALNSHTPSANLITAANGAGSATAVGGSNTFIPLSCGVGVDFVFVGSHPTATEYETICNESDEALRRYCADRRFLFVDVRSAFPATFQESSAAGYQDSDGLHLTLSGTRLVNKFVGETLRIKELLQAYQFGVGTSQMQTIGGTGVSHSWYVNYDSTSLSSLPELGLNRLDAGTVNSMPWWAMAPLPTSSGPMSTGVTEKIANATFRQVDAGGRNAFGFATTLTRTIGETAPFVGSVMEVGGMNAAQVKLTVSGVSGQTAPIFRIVTGASSSNAGTQVAGFSQLGIPFAALTSYANDAAASADAALPSGGFYQITGSRQVLRKP